MIFEHLAPNLDDLNTHYQKKPTLGAGVETTNNPTEHSSDPPARQPGRLVSWERSSPSHRHGTAHLAPRLPCEPWFHGGFHGGFHDAKPKKGTPSRQVSVGFWLTVGFLTYLQLNGRIQQLMTGGLTFDVLKPSTKNV